MSELRRDPITGSLVIIAPERAARPDEFHAPPAHRAVAGLCPFCPGREADTPPEIFAFRESGAIDQPGWRVRVVPNKYPAMEAHEVIIETPDHNLTLPEVSPDHAAQVVYCYQGRMLELKQNASLQYIMLFKNQGESAGATIEHTHSQLLALPAVPPMVVEELEGSRAYYERTGACPFCHLISQEPRERLVMESPCFQVLSPFAARFPFETWIVPRRHLSHFESADLETLTGLASVLQAVLQRINEVLKRPSYNVVIHSAPIRCASLANYHWHIRIIPRLNRIGGFEWGTGVYINPTPPEEAARRLRPPEV